MVDLGAKFHAESGYEQVSTFDPETFSRTLQHLIQSPSGFLAVTNNGFIGGLLVPFFFNEAQTTAQEVFWFVEPEGRKLGEGVAMLESFESWAQDMGASAVLMLNIESLDGVRALYESRGYKRQEQSWMRVV